MMSDDTILNALQGLVACIRASEMRLSNGDSDVPEMSTARAAFNALCLTIGMAQPDDDRVLDVLKGRP